MPQDTPKTPLRQEIASAHRDIFWPSTMGLLRPRDDVLLARGGGKGLWIYDEIERDPHVFSVLDKRRKSVVARAWEVIPGGPGRAERKATELVERVLKGDFGLKFDRACYELLDALLKGFAVGEVIWDMRDGRMVPVNILPRDQRRFVFTEEDGLRLLTMQNPLLGEKLPERKFIVHRFGSNKGDPYGLGLGQKLFWPVYFKRQSIVFWLMLNEKYGSPTVKGTYPTGMLDEEQQKLLETIGNIGQKGALIVPEGTVVELLESARSSTVNSHELLCRFMDEQISVAVLGETLTTNIQGGGSRAASQTHNDVREEGADFDADMLCETLNDTLIRWIVEANFPGVTPPTVWRPRPRREEEEAITQQEQIKARQMAVDFCTSMRTAGFAPEDVSADIIAQTHGKWTWSGGGVPAEFSAPPLNQNSVHHDSADELAAQLDQVAAPAMDALIGQIERIVAESASLDEVAERLVRLYPTLDATALGKAMAAALTVAELTGRAEIVDGH
ncbi:MAG: DUF935 family protein [Alphaproteobacteria bacterium]|nr:DUF935 family protein [Alphaproteobacteria bacterium]